MDLRDFDKTPLEETRGETNYPVTQPPNFKPLVRRFTYPYKYGIDKRLVDYLNTSLNDFLTGTIPHKPREHEYGVTQTEMVMIQMYLKQHNLPGIRQAAMDILSKN